MQRRFAALFVVIFLALGLIAVPVRADPAVQELDRWVKSYGESIQYAFTSDWLTRAVPKSQMIQASIELVATQLGITAPRVTGDAAKDVATALSFLRSVLEKRAQNEWEDIFRAALDGLVQKWDPWAAAMSPVDAAILMLQLGLYDEGDGVFFSFSEEKNVYFVAELVSEMGGAKAGLRIGDELVAVNGIPMSGLTEADMYRIDREARKSGFTLYRIRRDGNILDVKVEYLRRKTPKIKYELIGGTVGYILITSVEIYTGYEVEDAVNELVAKGARSFVLDLRGNPGGQPWGTQVTLSVLKQGDLFGRRSRSGDKLITIVVRSLPVERVFSGPVAVLVDQTSASASEIMAFVLKSRPKTRVFGYDIQWTKGKGVGQVGKELANGWFFYFTDNEIVDLQGKSYHGQGVAVDEEVVVNSGGATDKALERAVAWLTAQK